jgi:hypothetical protein
MAGEFLKGFSKFFTNLTPAQRQEVERAFNDLQNSKEMTSLDESLRLLIRKPDQRLPIPVLDFVLAPRGATVTWAALPDQRINFYEADVSTFSNFASFTTIPTFGTQVVLNGLASTEYIRVRGVRRDGTTTPYSETGIISPNAFDIRSHSAEAFYIPIIGTAVQTVIGGPGTVLEYTPINPSGVSMVWGFLTAYGHPTTALSGNSSIKVSLMVTTTQADGGSIDEEYVRITLGEYFNSQNIGPIPVEHPDLGGTISIRLDVTDGTTTQLAGTRLVDATEVQWCHLNVLELGTP